MSGDILHSSDFEVRGALTSLIGELGFAPSSEKLAQQLSKPLEEIEASLNRLHAAHALLLHPHVCRPWVVHPFALAPGSCWVQTANRGYWANCLYCAFGICAAVRSDAVITTRYGGEADSVKYVIKNGQAQESDDVFHLSTPARHWWDNVVFACSSFQPFPNSKSVDAWCERHCLPQGEMMAIPHLWEFAADWYGKYLEKPWRKRSLQETKSLFSRHNLCSDFWSIEE